MKKKIIISIIVLSFIALFVYLYIANKKTAYKKEPINPEKLTSDTSGTSNLNAKDSFPLKNGSIGSRVEELQRWINSQALFMSKFTKIPNTPLSVDGIFGNKTETAIKAIGNFSLIKYTTEQMYPVTDTFYIDVVVPKLMLRTVMNFEGAIDENPLLNIYKGID